MFQFSISLDLDLSNLDTSNVRSMEGMFLDAKLSNVNLENFNTKMVKTMKSIFNGTKIKDLDISNFDFRNVESMELSFANLKVDFLDLSNPFHKVKNLTSVFLHSTFNQLNIEGLSLQTVS